MNDNQNTTTYNFYFEVSFKTKGLVPTTIADIDELRNTLNHDLSAVYGEGNFTIDVLQPATEEQIKMVEDALSSYKEELEAEDSDEEVPPTLN